MEDGVLEKKNNRKAKGGRDCSGPPGAAQSEKRPDDGDCLERQPGTLLPSAEQAPASL